MFHPICITPAPFHSLGVQIEGNAVRLTTTSHITDLNLVTCGELIKALQEARAHLYLKATAHYITTSAMLHAQKNPQFPDSEL